MEEAKSVTATAANQAPTDRSGTLSRRLWIAMRDEP